MLDICKINYLQPADLYISSTYAYSHITRINVSEIKEIVHIAGQGGENLRGEISDQFKQQAEQVFLNLQYALHHYDLNWNNIAQMTILIVDHSSTKHAEVIKLMQQYFTQPNFPACTLIPVPCLALANMQIEIDAVAYRFK